MDLLQTLKKQYVDKRKEFDAYRSFCEAYGDEETKVSINAKGNLARLKYDIEQIKTSIDRLDVDDQYERLMGGSNG